MLCAHTCALPGAGRWLPQIVTGIIDSISKTVKNAPRGRQRGRLRNNLGTARIERVAANLITLAPKTLRRDAIQTFVAQETPILRIRCSDGSEGVGYSYTIGTGGSSIMSLLKDHLAPLLIGRDPDCIEAIWRDLIFHTHATHVGAVTSLDWDWDKIGSLSAACFEV